jgi:hypothetical protein
MLEESQTGEVREEAERELVRQVKRQAEVQA